MPDDRYTLCKRSNGTWSVVDIFTDFPAIVDGRVMIGMDMEEADDMVDLLNILDRKRRAEQAP
ncbi:hypothetical protein [Aurantimonas endophytica]|uniref:Uncharacterized protein n=1 Tax=Aurantimonas endophytica TaxID=1522175 RepID=A0A7W6HDK3_9HYPH|nr:hypothetical protein [Aurantimonas endophytica]MBB4003173.1 hypothetical protein [Aurantimonas endophytica]MCO6404043.1 hypothetical protein [Aurantimonas endophytica]